MRMTELIRTVLRIGLTGYGGPAIFAQTKQVMVKQKSWITEPDFMEGLGLSQMLPGAIGVTLMGYIGLRFKGPWGVVIVPFVFAVPAFVFMVVLSWAYFAYGQLPIVRSLFLGMGALVVALLINAMVALGRSVFAKKLSNPQVRWGIALLAFLLTYFLHVSVPVMVVLAALAGFLLLPKKEGAELQTVEARYDRKTIHQLVGMFSVLVILMGVISLTQYRELFYTFAHVGILAFGGGFTSIPLMHSVVVDTHHWLTMTEFRDGIALGQVTPGPVLITAAFVGYKLLGVLGAAVATFGIFMPSLVGISVLSIFHEQVKSAPKIQSTLQGVLAGFMGLLAVTTVRFGLQSLINWQTWLIFVASLGLLVGLKKDPLWAILGTAIFSVFFL